MWGAIQRNLNSGLNSVRSAGAGIWALALVAMSALVSSWTLAQGSSKQWLSEGLLNVGFVGLGLILALVIGERLIAKAERRHWLPVESAINGRAFRAALMGLGGFADAPSIRSELGDRGMWDLPTVGDLQADYEVAYTFLSEKLLPATKRYTSLRPPPRTTDDFVGFSQADWASIRNGIETCASLTTQLLMISGARQGPALQTAILEMDAAVQLCQRLFAGRDGPGYHGSGAGEMAYQVSMLVSFDRFVESAVHVVDRLRDRFS